MHLLAQVEELLAMQCCDAAACAHHTPRYLLGPLSGLASAGASSSPLPCTVLLLDALDEADDEGKGWLPVARLVAKE